jgi:hypothetical protein
MVIKALFLGCPLYAISGLDHRVNYPLSHMVVDFIRSRRAAGQPVSPEAFRLIGPHADDRTIGELERSLESGDAAWREAAALALARNGNPRSCAVLERAGDLRRSIEDGRLTWDGFTRRRLVV